MQQNTKPIRLNRQKPIVTIVLLGVLALIFVLDLLSKLFITRSGYGVLSLYGMKINELVTHGQWWRLLSANLLHANLMHLAANGIGLYIWGRYIELFYGRGRYAVILLLSGLACTAASYAFCQNPSLGASGMVFGLYGAMLGIRKFDKKLFNAVFGVQLLLYIGISVFWGFTSGTIDNFGHLGGLAGGFLAARFLGMLGEEVSMGRRLAYGVGYVMFFGLCTYLGFAGLPF
ncbi:MAG: rhomboid family intramembrane serine protease [Eubacteriales bacterium]|nr:rhomboid family intramembrane serine protease [Eubacteriales bacterium]